MRAHGAGFFTGAPSTCVGTGPAVNAVAPAARTGGGASSVRLSASHAQSGEMALRHDRWSQASR